MNLAQLIDPERAREGFGKSSLERKPAALAPLPSSKHVCLDPPEPATTSNGQQPLRSGRIPTVRAALARPGGPYTTNQVLELVAGACGVSTAGQVAGALCQLVRQKDARSIAQPGHAKAYELTAQGRGKVPPPNEP